jgi:hypothetical protein
MMVNLFRVDYAKTFRVGLLSVLGLASSHAMAATVEEKIEILQQEIESLKDQIATAPNGNRAKGIQSLSDHTTIGGYGELHYNNYEGSATKKDEIDFHRFVIYLGHRFNDWISFKSELELEHSNTENGGAVELEQAYLDFNFNKQANVKAGVFLMPLGFINETHEPPTFYGVERNEVEKRIIPSTWWEAGAALYGELTPGWKYQAGLTSSLSAANFAGFAAGGLREGRRNVSEAPAENIAFSGRLDYSGTPGLLLGGSLFTGNTGQGNVLLQGVDARLTLWDLHARYKVNKFDLRALYAQGHLADSAKINQAFGLDTASRFYGWYTEAAYHIYQQGDHDVAPFVRFEQWDTQASLSGSAKNNLSNNNIWTLGVNYYPHPQIVLKADYQSYDKADGGKGDKRINLGMGYMF